MKETAKNTIIFCEINKKNRTEKIVKLFLPLLHNPPAKGKNKVSTIHRGHHGAAGSAISEKKEP